MYTLTPFHSAKPILFPFRQHSQNHHFPIIKPHISAHCQAPILNNSTAADLDSSFAEIEKRSMLQG
jgi:hypothetical protein